MCANCGLATAETCPPKQELRPRGARPVNSSIYIYRILEAPGLG